MTDITLRLKQPQNLPLIGRIRDDVNFGHAKLPLHMWEEGEEIPDDPEDANGVKDAEYYKQMRRRRRTYYRSKQLFKFEDSTTRAKDGAPLGLCYEGKIWDPTISNEIEKQEKKLYVNYKKEQEEDNSFRYVLLVPTKVPSEEPGGASRTEINVVPVRDFVLFTKPAIMKMKTLDELDADYETKQQKESRHMGQYARIMKGLSALEAAAAGGQVATEDNEDINVEKGIKGFVLPSLFGLEAGSKVKKGLRKGANAKLFLNENGVDLDSVKAVGDMFEGDYEAHFNDNEETYADEADNAFQQEQEREGEEEVTRETAALKGELGEEEDDDDDSDDDDDDEVIGTTVGGIQMVDDKMLMANRLIARELNQAAGVAPGKKSDAESLLGGGGGGKRKAPDADNSDKAAASAGGGGGEAAPMVKKIKAEGQGQGQAASVGAPHQPLSQHELSEDGVRAYLLGRGGQAPLDQLKSEFQPLVKAANKASPTGDVGKKRWVRASFHTLIYPASIHNTILRQPLVPPLTLPPSLPHLSLPLRAESSR